MSFFFFLSLSGLKLLHLEKVPLLCCYYFSIHVQREVVLLLVFVWSKHSTLLLCEKTKIYTFPLSQEHTSYTSLTQDRSTDRERRRATRKKESSFFRSRTANAHVLFIIFIHLFHQVFVFDDDDNNRNSQQPTHNEKEHTKMHWNTEAGRIKME